MSKLYCSMPNRVASINDDFGFSNCLAANPKIKSGPEDNFSNWWNSNKMAQFRGEFGSNHLPATCKSCEHSEQLTGESCRTKNNDILGTELADWPEMWEVSFGNTCNLGCWVCNESQSSVIEGNKKQTAQLPSGFVSPRLLFLRRWKTLQHDILKSYEHHDTVFIVATGGEPLYSRELVEFVEVLRQKGLHKRTSLKIITNATVFTDQAKVALQDLKHLSIVLSLDAVGRKSEWLRYGSNWKKITKNIALFKQYANHLQISATVSVLNVMDLPALKQFADDQSMALTTTLVTHPEFLSLASWPGNPADLVDRQALEDSGFSECYDIIGENADSTAPKAIKAYIESFSSMRDPLRKFDPDLSTFLNLRG